MWHTFSLLKRSHFLLLKRCTSGTMYAGRTCATCFRQTQTLGTVEHAQNIEGLEQTQHGIPRIRVMSSANLCICLADLRYGCKCSKIRSVLTAVTCK